MSLPYEKDELQVILENSTLPADAQNLRRKMDSIMRTIENLSAKKLNIELEIKTQKKVLAKKRLELKKRTKSNQVKLSAAIESGPIAELPEEYRIIQKMDQELLRESSRVLED